MRLQTPLLATLEETIAAFLKRWTQNCQKIYTRFYASQKIYKKDFFYILNYPQTATASKQQHH